MKKIIIILLVVAILVCGGIFAFYKVRDYVTEKMITQLENTEEMQEYIKGLKEKEAAEALAREEKDDTKTPDDEESKEEDKKEGEEEEKTEDKPAQQSGAGGFWDEPLVKSVYARYTASEIASVSAMAAGGFTPEEKKQVKAIVFGKMSRAELNEIIKLYNKHN